MTRRDDIVAFIEEYYPDHAGEILLADGFDDAFVGIGRISNGGTPIAVYDADKCIERHRERRHRGRRRCSDDRTRRFYKIRAFAGDYTPMFVTPLSVMTMMTAEQLKAQKKGRKK